MRISDWSSDVCSSDLGALGVGVGDPVALVSLDEVDERLTGALLEPPEPLLRDPAVGGARQGQDRLAHPEIGREPSRESVCPYVEVSGVAVTLKTKQTRKRRSTLHQDYNSITKN